MVNPTGQQPYDISGSLKLDNDNGGEVVGAVYMMDSVKGSNAPWKRLTVSGQNNDFTFNSTDTFENSTTDFATMYSHDIDKLIDAVVTSDLSDPVDNKNYTLYFLVRYPKEELKKSGEYMGPGWDTEHTTWKYIIDIKATLTLTHTGVDSNTQQTANKEQRLYYGALDVEQQIYFASYVNSAVENKKALTALEKGMPVNLDFAADFFCLNEARNSKDIGSGQKYALEAIIDLSYITDGLTSGSALQNAPQLQSDDYRFSAVDITLVDAPGNWSQDWNYQDDVTGGWRGTPNVGWTLETWGNETLAQQCNDIIVYGSTSLTEDTWTQITTFEATDVWALNQDRNFRTGQNQTTEFSIPKENKYLRLKVVYTSQYTTALRVGYQLEIQPGIYAAHPGEFNKNKETQELTSWFNYMGYKNGEVSAKNADTEYMKFQRYPTSDAGWNLDDAGTVEKARQYDNTQSDFTGFNSTKGIGQSLWGSSEIYSYRHFTKATLKRFEESAGMIITQAIYDSTNQLIGDANSLSLDAKDSYALRDSVTNVSEIVFNLSGALTDGSSDIQELEEYRTWLNDPTTTLTGDLKTKKSLYNSTKIRYYVLLPKGMKLNLDPDDGHEPDENDAPYYHFWTTGTDEYLSASSSFYNNNSPKVVQSGETDVPVSKSNIPGWERQSANGSLSEMWWVAGTDDATEITGTASVVKDTKDKQLVIFERELAPTVLGERFNMWGTSETYFWGRGLSFSIIPDGPVGSLPSGDFTTYVWCQYLDDDGNPINIDGFRTGTFKKNTTGDIKEDTVDEDNKDVNEDLLNKNLDESKQQDKDTLLYIPIDFKNRSASGDTYAKISLESEYRDADGSPIVQFDKNYNYRLEYGVNNRSSKNVVLWTNIEQEMADKPYYQGIITGVDLSELTDAVRSNVKVYINKAYFNSADYTTGGASKDWLTNSYDWEQIDIETYSDWASVKAIAFYFEGVEFNAATNPNSATVKIKMKGPERDDKYLDLDGQPEKTYYAVSPLIFSDTHQGDGDSDENACTAANEVVVSVTVRSLTLPATGGFGARDFVTVGLVFCMGGTAIYLRARRRRIRPGRGNPYRM